MRKATPRKVRARLTYLTESSLLLLPLLVLCACRDATAPLPDGARRFEPPPVYARWWALTEGCAGRAGNFAAYSWYVVPGNYAPLPSNPYAAGYADVVARRIVLSESLWDSGGDVRHEMLHALLGREYARDSPALVHPPEYFQGRCAGVVACPGPCAEAGPAPLTAPANAPELPLSDLLLNIELLTSPASWSGSDSILSIIVGVTNPNAEARWVSLEPSPAIAQPYTSYFSFQIARAGRDTQLVSLVQSVPTGRVPFAGHQARTSVHDINLRGFRLSPGEYIVGGAFNTRPSVRASLRVLP